MSASNTEPRRQYSLPKDIEAELMFSARLTGLDPQDILEAMLRRQIEEAKKPDPFP